jgi:putative nucleotidyltransferase with HDIG domain
MKLELRKMLHNLGALTDLGAEISSTHNFNEVIRTSLHTLLGTLAIPKGAVTRLAQRPRQLRVIASKGISDSIGQKILIGRREVEELQSQARSFDLSLDLNGLKHFVDSNGEFLKRLRASIAVPMVVAGELEGVIFLSRKFNGNAFTDEDIDIVNTITRHIGIAFYNHKLLVSLRRKAEENRRLYKGMRQMYLDTIRAFGAAIDLKDTYTKGHSDRVARYAEGIAREMGISGDALERIGVAGYLHDIGKIVVDRSIINNPHPLNEKEYHELNRHVTTGYEILSNINHPWKEIAYLTKCHHEKVDGTGYPQGLQGDEIPLGSKIVTVADSFDAMMTDRPYRARLTLANALAELRRQTNKQFAKEVVAAFCRLLLREIQGTAKQRVVIPMIGLSFDRTEITGELMSMIAEFEQSTSTRLPLKRAAKPS